MALITGLRKLLQFGGCKIRNRKRCCEVCRNSFSTFHILFTKEEKDPDDTTETRVSVIGLFTQTDRKKESFFDVLSVFKERDKQLRGHVEFIYLAMKYMKEFDVHRDLEAYKKLMDVFPKAKMIPENVFQVALFHYPKQQDCAIDLLDKMESCGVMPDSDLAMIIMTIFGKDSGPFKKLLRQLYWMPKMKNVSPWPLADFLPNDALELGKLAVKRMCSVDPTSVVSILQTKDVEDSIDDTWIVSGQSQAQRELIHKLPSDHAIKVEGPFRIYLRDKVIGYFILRSEPIPGLPQPTPLDTDDVSQLHTYYAGVDEKNESNIVVKKSVHEQDDGNILGICCTGTSSRDSLLSWVRLLNITNTILFTQSSPVGEVMTTKEENQFTDVQTTT